MILLFSCAQAWMSFRMPIEHWLGYEHGKKKNREYEMRRAAQESVKSISEQSASVREQIYTACDMGRESGFVKWYAGLQERR